MLAELLLVASLHAAPTLASPDFTTANVNADVARFCNEHLSQQLGVRGLKVTTSRQIAALIGLERQKQLLGCADDGSSCMAELAAALGVDAMLLGDLGRLGSKYQLNLRVVSTKDARTVANWSRTVNSEDDLLDALNDAARELQPKILAAFGATGTPAPTEVVSVRTQRVGRQWPLVPTLLAGGFAVASAVCFGVAAGTHFRLTDPRAPAGSIQDGEAAALVTQGEVTQWLGVGTAIAAGVTLGVNVLLWALSGHDEPLASLFSPWRGALQEAWR